ncbi:MAG: glycosyltransferase family 4 protein [Deltaproteobacteria bacterium]|nr:glycosyltransferase family 4 protein [Deltaproteobacteria bacterium]
MSSTPTPADLRAAVYLFFPGKGIGRYTHELMNALARRDEVRAELLCLPSYQFLEQASYRVWPKLREISHPWPPRRRARFLLGQATNPVLAISRAVRTGAKVLHLSNINHLSFPLWRPLLDRSGLKLVATAHDVRRGKAIIHRPYEEQQLRAFYERADALFVHSRAQREDLLGFARVHSERIHEVPHGTYDHGAATSDPITLRARYGLPREHQVALFFGDLRDDKNLDLLLHALARANAPVHLVVAGSPGGDGPHKGLAFYKALASDLGIEARVTFLGRFIPDAEVPDLFAAADWVAIPYSRTFSSQSGVLNVAMHYQRPVLASGAPTLKETLAAVDVGVFVDPDRIDALEVGIAEISHRTEPYDFEGYAARYGWTANAELTASVYRSITTGR